MPVRNRGGLKLRTAAFALLALGAVAASPALAQDRTLASLADVPAIMPTPYHPQMATAVYSSSLYDGGAHFWH